MKKRWSVAFSLGSDDLERLDELCRDLGCSRSFAIRFLIRLGGASIRDLPGVMLDASKELKDGERVAEVESSMINIAGIL